MRVGGGGLGNIATLVSRRLRRHPDRIQTTLNFLSEVLKKLSSGGAQAPEPPWAQYRTRETQSFSNPPIRFRTGGVLGGWGPLSV